MNEFFNSILYVPLETLLLFLYNLTGENLGVAIIILTILIRIVLYPLMLPTLKSSQKMKELKKPLDDIKKKHKNDPKKLQEEQLKLYKEHGINPAAGCLPLLLQLPILIFLYRVFLNVIASEAVNPHFFIFDLSQPDSSYILPVLAAVVQFILAFAMSPIPEKKEEKKEKKDEDFAESISGALQTQNLYIMPLLWFFMLLKLPAGIGIYWVISTLFSLIQQLIVVGPGRLQTVFNKK